jgi:hypothetical protein
MRHYLLTRSAYAPDVPLEVNRKRLALTRGVLARSLAAQTFRDVTWVVMVDEADPLYDERVDALRSAGLPLILAHPGDIVRNDVHDLPWGPWAQNLDWSGPVLTTRIDRREQTRTVYLPPNRSVPVLIPAADERRTDVFGQAVLKAGLKMYATEKAFFTTEFKLGFREDVDHVVWKVGFGVDF